MSTTLNLTGPWLGHYRQHDRRHAIAADLVQAGERLTGSMRDHDTDHEYSLFQIAAEAGLAPGADEQMFAQLRALFPDDPSAPIRYRSHLPPESVLEGRVNGSTVYFLKTYQGTSFGGFRIGDKMVGTDSTNHTVHYQGQLSPDGTEIEGTWWIDPNPKHGTARMEGIFSLRRQEHPGLPAEPAPPQSVPDMRPWWKFWR
jgi:hypothetical protein